MNRTVVFVMSHNYSGSTWLSLMLGSHSRAFYLGEVNKCFSHKHHRGCSTCEVAQCACPYFADLDRLPRSELYPTLFERSGADVLVDNSKRIKWCRPFTGDTRYRRKYIHLIRDPRGVYYSIQLRGRVPELADWAARNHEIHRFLRDGACDFRVLTYDELAERTDESMSALCDWLELRYEPAQKQYWTFEHHGPGANGAAAAFLESARPSDADFYAERRRSNFNDLRWQQHLAPAVVQSIETNPDVTDLLDRLGLCIGRSGLERRRSVAAQPHAVRAEDVS